PTRRSSELGCLAVAIAQVVQLRATDLTAGQNLELVDVRGVHWDGALHADAEGDLADGEGLADAGALALDHDATEDLHAGLAALDDLQVHVDGVTCAGLCDIVAQLCCIDLVKNMHGLILCLPGSSILAA